MTTSQKFPLKRELKGSESFPFQMSRKISVLYLIMGDIQENFACSKLQLDSQMIINSSGVCEVEDEEEIFIPRE
jgi:hypothetical protein